MAEACGVAAGAALALGVGDGEGVTVRFVVGVLTAATVGDRTAVGDGVGLGTGVVADVAAGRAVAAAPQASNIPPSKNNNNRPVSCITRNSRRRSAGCPLTEEGRCIYHKIR